MFFFRRRYKEKDLITALIKDNCSYEKLDRMYKSLAINLNELKYKNKFILHACCEKDLSKSVIWLLNNNIKVNLANKNNETAIFYAIFSKDTNILAALYSCNANFNHLNYASRTALQEAIYNSNRKIIRYLLKTTKAIANKDINGNNVLFDTINKGNFELAKKIIELNKIDLNEINMNGETILHLQNTINNNNFAMHLLQCGANPTIKDQYGKSFLSYAVLGGIKNSNLIKRASFLGFNINLKNSNGKTILMDASKHFLSLCISKSSDIEDQAKLIKELIFMETTINEVDDNNENFFFDITRSKNVDLIIYILKNIPNFNLNKNNNIGVSPLLLLIFGGPENFELIQFYILNNASLEHKNNLNKNAIEIIIEIILHKENNLPIQKEYESFIRYDCDYKELLQLLIKKYEINLNQLNSKGEPLFFSFIINFNSNLVKMFRRIGFNINEKDKDGNNIIFKLLLLNFQNKIKNKHIYLDLLKNLVKIGANINDVNKNNITPIELAIENNCINTLKLILELNPYLNILDNKGRNLIHKCVFNNNNLYIEEICKYNKDIINMCDNYGVTPIEYACFMGEEKVVLSLIKLKASIENKQVKSPHILSFLKKYNNNILKLSQIQTNNEYKEKIQKLINNIVKEFNISKSV